VLYTDDPTRPDLHPRAGQRLAGRRGLRPADVSVEVDAGVDAALDGGEAPASTTATAAARCRAREAPGGLLSLLALASRRPRHVGRPADAFARARLNRRSARRFRYTTTSSRTASRSRSATTSRSARRHTVAPGAAPRRGVRRQDEVPQRREPSSLASMARSSWRCPSRPAAGSRACPPAGHRGQLRAEHQQVGLHAREQRVHRGLDPAARHAEHGARLVDRAVGATRVLPLRRVPAEEPRLATSPVRV